MAPISILVLGAGELGGEILRSLVAHPLRSDSTVSVLMRPATINATSTEKRAQVDALTSLGVVLVPGDVANASVEQLGATFSHYHTVINATGMTLPPGTQAKVAKAAITSGCQRYFPWQFGGDYDKIGRNSSQQLFDEQLDVRELLRGQERLDWVIVSTGMFTSFLFEPSFGVLNQQHDTVTGLGSWNTRITVTSPQDIGKVTAEIVMASPEVKGVVYAAGDTVSMQQIADCVDEALGRKVVRILKTLPQLKDELTADPDNGMLKYRVIFAEDVGTSWDKATTFNAQRNISTETMLEWCQKHLKS